MISVYVIHARVDLRCVLGLLDITRHVHVKNPQTNDDGIVILM